MQRILMKKHDSHSTISHDNTHYQDNYNHDNVMPHSTHSNVECETHGISEHYHEIILSVACKQPYLADIITQMIADVILEYGDGVEFLNKDMISFDSVSDDSMLDNHDNNHN